MPTVRSLLEERLRAALDALALDSTVAEVTPSADSRFGDYQSNAAMVLAKRERRNPRELGAAIAERIDVSGIAEPPQLAGAGFLNFRLTDAFLNQAAAGLLDDERCGLAPAAKPQTIIIDFSSPNVAKPMHVGHIRSTILGDCLARIARFLGHHVVTDNHIGDWGTQFGKVIYGWKHLLHLETLESDPIRELLRLYREVNALEETDESVRHNVREELVKLQRGDTESRAIWQHVVSLSWREFEKIYALLDVTFDERLGESFYNDALSPLCERLEREGIAQISEGALCVFFPEIPELVDKPCLVRKSDGGFLYATTDLATISYRMERWHPDAVWYVTGAPQALHFQQVFEVARRMGMQVKAEHVAFGSILGENRKIMKTRSGENVQLGDVLNEALERARTIIAEKNPDLPAEEAEAVARDIGIGAVKYAELSQHRMTDYVFSWEKMLSFQGNTAPYLQNAYVRIRSIFRKAAEIEPGAQWNLSEIRVTEPAERALVIKLMQFAETVPLVLADFRPNLLANYLYETATTFHAFYEACPVLKAESATRASRLALCELASRVLRTGLELLGIHCPERM
jgi:arginyl-tRNA synthetase